MVIDIRQCSSNSHERFRSPEFNHGIHHFDVSAWKIVFAAAKRRKKFGGGGARKFWRLRRRAVFFSAAAARTRFRLARRRNSAADRSISIGLKNNNQLYTHLDASST
jgi:hypothetical protein